MQLNTIKPAEGETKNSSRVGRGMGSGLVKTSGRGHNGQKSRSGASRKISFEGGQMPLQRRVPKFGFNSPIASTHDEIRLHELDRVTVDAIDLDALRAAGLIRRDITDVKSIARGAVSRAVTIKADIKVTKGARAAIEAAGGIVEA